MDHWRGKSIYDGDTTAAMVAAMLTAKPSATIPEPGEKVRCAAHDNTLRRDPQPQTQPASSIFNLTSLAVHYACT